MLLGLLKYKITVNATKNLISNGNLNTQPEIKYTLIEYYFEKNSADELIDKIRSCRCDSSIEIFCDKLNNYLSRLNNAWYFSNNGYDSQVSSNARIALHSFTHELPEPIKIIIVSHNPKILREDFKNIKTKGYLKYNNNKENFSTTRINIQLTLIEILVEMYNNNEIATIGFTVNKSQVTSASMYSNSIRLMPAAATRDLCKQICSTTETK